MCKVYQGVQTYVNRVSIRVTCSVRSRCDLLAAKANASKTKKRGATLLDIAFNACHQLPQLSGYILTQLKAGELVCQVSKVLLT